MLKRDGVEVIARADPAKGMTDAARKIAGDFNKKEPSVYSNGNHDYKKAGLYHQHSLHWFAERYLCYCLYKKKKYFLNYK